MKFHPTTLLGAYMIEPEPFTDNRGRFTRLYCAGELQEIGHYKPIMQINHSFTRHKGTIRGLHYQYPNPDIKTVRVLRGWIYDVTVDLREGSPTFLQHHVEFLEASKSQSVYIPEGFAHGFQTLEDNCEVLYFHTEMYNKENSKVIRYDDPRIGIEWPIVVTEISEQDYEAEYLTDEFKGV